MDLKQYIKYDVPIYAHTKWEHKETLFEHSNLCLDYYHKILRAKNLTNFFKTFSKVYFGTDSFENWLLNEAEKSVGLHDLGKGSPVFQKEKMKNPYEKRSPYKSINGSNHSLLSSILYLDCSLSDIEKMGLDRKDIFKKKLRALACLNAFIISRHHGGLEDPDSYFEKFKEYQEASDIIVELEDKRDCFFSGFRFFTVPKGVQTSSCFAKIIRELDRKQKIAIYTYCRLLHSLLVASDYYATTEYANGIITSDFGVFENVNEIRKSFENSSITKQIREYEKGTNGGSEDLSKVTDINAMRSEMFLETEKIFADNKEEKMFFLEAPTGSGKSNTAINLSLSMLGNEYNKIFYIYPFNTLVEQNIEVLRKTFGEDSYLVENMGVINSIEPIKLKGSKQIEDDSAQYYQTALLDRQFVNYPLVLSTHVSLFTTLFNKNKESIFPFLQLANSVIVLDEIQSYKNTIWAEIIIFLQVFSELLNIKIIIMSATLPDLKVLSSEKMKVVNLIKNRDRYFKHKLFCDRVEISYELLEKEFSLEKLKRHVTEHQRNKKILIEFISAKTAYDFYEMLQMDDKIESQVFLLRGDDNIVERKRVLEKLSQSDGNAILVATQIIEAGVDIDVDIGYKDISKLDSEEQFMGRINRSCKHHGIVYFFNKDRANHIYKNDVRISNSLTLDSDEMRKILSDKDFSRYYNEVMKLIQEQFNKLTSEVGLDDFFNDKVGMLKFKDIETRMKLIDKNQNKVSVFFNLVIKVDDDILYGSECWQEYKEVLFNTNMEYAEKKIKLSRIASKMNYFIYEINANNCLLYDDVIGEMGYIEDGETYFFNGKLNYSVLYEEKLFI